MGSGRFSMMSVGLGGDLVEPRMLKAISFGILHLIVQLSIYNVQVEATVTKFVVPGNILKGNKTTMQCNFDDDINNIINFFWSSSTPDVINRADADELLSYDVSSQNWVDSTNGRFTATMDRDTKSSTLTLGSVELDDEKKYWCIIQVFGDTWENTSFAIVNALDTSATDLLWLDGGEVESSITLTDGTYQFECIVVGAKPAPTVTWTFDGDIFPDPNPIISPNEDEDPRLFDSNSTFSVTINNTFGTIGKVLTCKATVPADDETSVSDTVTITRDDTGKKLTEGEKWGIGVGVVVVCVGICAGVAVGSKIYKDKK